MSDKRKPLLPKAPPARLEDPTIMDRALAAEHGTAYVQLAAFAIDIDRAYAAPHDVELPFGWEVFLAEAYALGRVDARREQGRALLEDTCLAVLAQPPDEQGFGSQLVFAVYHALRRGWLPPALAPVFASWRKPPKQLLAALDALWNDAESQLRACAGACLQQTLDPPLSPPTRNALQAMRDGAWPLPDIEADRP